MPASGDQTFNDIEVFEAEKGTGLANPNPAAAVIVVPAQDSAVADLITLTTVLEEFVGSVTIVEASAPPNPITP